MNETAILTQYSLPCRKNQFLCSVGSYFRWGILLHPPLLLAGDHEALSIYYAHGGNFTPCRHRVKSNHHCDNLAGVVEQVMRITVKVSLAAESWIDRLIIWFEIRDIAFNDTYLANAPRLPWHLDFPPRMFILNCKNGRNDSWSFLICTLPYPEQARVYLSMYSKVGCAE